MSRREASLAASPGSLAQAFSTGVGVGAGVGWSEERIYGVPGIPG